MRKKLLKGKTKPSSIRDSKGKPIQRLPHLESIPSADTKPEHYC